LELPLKLETIEFATAPTEEELEKMLRDMKDFIAKVAGALIYLGKYPAVDQSQKMGNLLGCSHQLQNTIDALRGQSNIARPQLQMQPRPQ
jgi:hypothetical protein